jgi:predicted nucleic acid-binding protein
MGLRCVFDSVILIDCLNGNQTAFARLAETPERFISVITRTEVLTGTKNQTERENAIDALDSCENVSVNQDIAELAADLRQLYRLKTADAIIYATAKMLGATLVTRDKAFPDEADVVRV